jgi:acetyl esterase/lipase
MKGSHLAVVLLVASFWSHAPVRAQGSPTIDVGDSLFGCASAASMQQLNGYAATGDMAAFGTNLLADVRTGKCVLFKTGEQLVPTGLRNANLVQVRPQNATNDYWTSKRSLDSIKPPLPTNHGRVATQLFLGNGKHAPLLVGLGGGEGGNAWASDHWKHQRDIYLQRGYAFLAVGYFGMQGTPAKLDRISLDGIHSAILEAAKNPKVDGDRIAVIGGSKGGELALELASHYADIKAVVAIVPSDVAFFSLAAPFDTASWTYHGKPVAFVPFDGRALPAVLHRDLKTAFAITREDDAAALGKAKIEVGKINGPVLLVSASDDELWASTMMSDQMEARLKAIDFPHAHEHIVIKGAHTEPQRHFDLITAFLDKHFPARTTTSSVAPAKAEQ